MEKDRFLFLVKNYTSLTREEATELISLKKFFPYSQVIHNICTRAAQDHLLDSRDKLLHASAIYTTDRAVLKAIMSSPHVDRKVVHEAPDIPAVERIAAPMAEKEERGVAGKIENTLSGEALRNDLLQELSKLEVLKHKFEVSVEEFEKGNAPSSDTEESKKKIRKTAERIEPADSLIEEIKTTKVKVNPEGPKQKEQIEIIENFIKTRPTISKNKLTALPAEGADLAEKSLHYGDSTVSETLVEVLIKQGKKAKAIEVLKKLIWKFPQKKAYFAAQIEELKK